MPAIPKQLISAGFLILQGRPNVESFLLMRHPRRWDLPKGHLDPGETILECAYRELEEETGIAADQVEHLADFRFETSYEVRYKKFGNAPLPKTTVIFLGRLPERVRHSLDRTPRVPMVAVGATPRHSARDD